ncbi:hypothetical protein NQ315_004614 [Exocentrus adspersus]|uniref:Major facilitator superfamily (MFS) profile domain-containing protein n=1 Tax=Exocentrus adspersus TaxID=1586481 RepID=A0AAV8VPB7_9CUCU|nr:hypothetical protein NQ315_004614 [Exocentrus adspersus]
MNYTRPELIDILLVSVEVVEVEEYDVVSDGEPATETLKLTTRGRPGAYTPPRRRSSARDETKKEIQDDDEATLRELLIRWRNVKPCCRDDDDDDDDNDAMSQSSTALCSVIHREIRSKRIFLEGKRIPGEVSTVVWNTAMVSLPPSLQKQVSVMSMNLSAKLDELQRGDRHLETTVALCEIRTQLQELTKSVESCQTEVSEVKRDMVAIKHELDTVQQVKEEIEELREYVDRLEEHSHRRKLRLLEQGLTFFLSYAILAAVLGMLQFGYNTGVINAPQGNIQNFMKDVYKGRYGQDVNDDYVKLLYSIAVSIFAIGGMLGGILGGFVANKFGRKRRFAAKQRLGNNWGVCNVVYKNSQLVRDAIFWQICYRGQLCPEQQTFELVKKDPNVLVFPYGLNTSLVPMYISEISPLNLRGGLGTVNQLAVTVGLLLSQVLGIEQILGTNDGWPLLLGLAVCPALLQLVLLPICPESPRYLLITKQWEEEARKALRRLRASNAVEEDIEEMRAEERAQQAEASISMWQLICSPTLRMPLIIGIVMQLSQQLSGINAVFYYSTDLFKNAGLTAESAKFATNGIGCIMVFMTLISIPLMDKTGRRTLHLYGLGGMFIFSICITISFLIKEFFGYVQEMIDWMSYLSVFSTLGFVTFFALGPGSIPWMITAELFSQGPRPAAMSIAVLVNWMANFVVGIGFPSMMVSP